MSYSSMDAARRTAVINCQHPTELLRSGSHRDVTSRWVAEDIQPDALYCLRCEQAVPRGGQAREAERARRRAHASEMADRLYRSVLCQQVSPDSHRKCLGPAASMNSGWGCLCPCHDGDPAHQTHATEASA